MDPGIVLFAIQAGVKLGRKIHDVLIDETAEGALLLPVGKVFGDVQEGIAGEYI